MHRSLSAALMAAWWLVGLGPLPAKAEAGTSETLSQARALLDRGEARAAVPLLEDALPDVAATDRAPLLDLLREAYETAIPLAEAGGRNAEAEQYRENLEILSRKARPRTAPAAPLSKPEPSRAEPRRERPSLAPIDAAIRRAALPSEQSPLPTPEPASVPEPVKPPAPANAIANTAPTESRPPSPAAPPPMPAGPTAKANLAADVLKADTAFIGKKYAEAGQLYANLDREQRLPSSRRDHWAYCRWVEVVRRINAKPGTPEQWSRIDEEIEKIRALSPKNWFGEYLRNRAAERTAGPKGNKPGGLVVRGSSPDEPPRATAPAKRPDRPRGVGSAPAPAPEAAHEVNRAAAMPGNWQVRETPNFRVMHADADLAEKVATVAEAARETQLKRWIGPAPRASSTWSPKCDVYLYPTARVFSEMTGQTEQSPGFSTMEIGRAHV